MRVTPERRMWRNERRKYDKRTLALVDGLMEARRKEWEESYRFNLQFMQTLYQFVQERRTEVKDA